ncbi:MAG TPA: single-stranded DNA-binding protein [Candidatus Eisenbacteria bacterium]
MDLNKVTLIGNMVREPESSSLRSGQRVTRFTLATNYAWQDARTKTKREAVDFHDVIAWGKLGDIVQQYLKKGRVQASSLWPSARRGGGTSRGKVSDRQGVEQRCSTPFSLTGASPRGGSDRQDWTPRAMTTMVGALRVPSTEGEWQGSRRR